VVQPGDRHYPAASMTGLLGISGLEIRVELIRTCGALVMFGADYHGCFLPKRWQAPRCPTPDIPIGSGRTARANTSEIEFYTACYNSMRDRYQPGLRDLHVVLRRVEDRPDRADYLAIDDDWKPPLHQGEALRRETEAPRPERFERPTLRFVVSSQ
jgi:hypothetical protein